MRRRHRPSEGASEISHINITNLVDVSMTTLIIYMLIAPLAEHGIDVRLPKSAPYKIVKENPVTVSVSAAGLIYLNNSRVTAVQLKDRLAALASARPEQAVIVRAADEVAYREVIAVLDSVKASGLSNLGLATRAER